MATRPDPAAYPSPEEGAAAFDAGRADGIAGRARAEEPTRGDSFARSCIVAAYSRGYNRGMQEGLQERYGAPPPVPATSQT